MKQIIYKLWILLFLFGCSESDRVDYASLRVDFSRSSVDVGENSGLLELPVVLSGVRNNLPLSVSVKIEAADGSAVAGTDYELLDKELIFERCGTLLLRIRMIDNKEVTEDKKDFTVTLKVETPEVQSVVSTVKVYIISDDMKPFELPGKYTLTAKDFKSGDLLKTEPGTVEIVQDAQNPQRYVLRNLILVKGQEVFPLSWADDLYIEVDESGNIQMPVMQKIGDYGKGEGFTISITPDGYAEQTPIRIRVSGGKKLVFMKDALAGVTLDKKKELFFYYVLKDIVLEKVIQ